LSAPVFTNNDSDIAQLEGLYIKERPPAATIQGVALNAVGVVGETLRGPVDTVVPIGSEAEFVSIFGGRDHNGDGTGTLVNKVWKALLNKPFGQLYVVRAAAAAAVAATTTLASSAPADTIRVDAASVGAWGNDIFIAIKNATDGDSNKFNLEVTYLGNVITYENLDVHSSGTDNTLAVIGNSNTNLIKVTKLASHRPANVSSFQLGTGGSAATAGSDGSIADSDFTASSRGVNLLVNYRGPDVVFIAERSSSTLRSYLNTVSATVADRVFLTCPDDETKGVSDAQSDLSAIDNDRLIYCFNHAYTVDPEVASEILTSPDAWMGSILSQIDVDIHPGEEDTKKFTAGITRLYNEGYSRSDYITLRKAGVCALEKDDGFAFVSGVTTSLVPGKEQITRRRMTDFLQLSVADFLKHSVKKKNTDTRKKANAGVIQSFLDDLQKQERVVKASDVDPDILNNPDDEANGIVRILMTVKLIGHMLEIVLETEIGTAVTVREAA